MIDKPLPGGSGIASERWRLNFTTTQENLFRNNPQTLVNDAGVIFRLELHLCGEQYLQRVNITFGEILR